MNATTNYGTFFVYIFAFKNWQKCYVILHYSLIVQSNWSLMQCTCYLFESFFSIRCVLMGFISQYSISNYHSHYRHWSKITIIIFIMQFDIIMTMTAPHFGINKRHTLNVDKIVVDLPFYRSWCFVVFQYTRSTLTSERWNRTKTNTHSRLKFFFFLFDSLVVYGIKKSRNLLLSNILPELFHEKIKSVIEMPKKKMIHVSICCCIH